MASVLAAPGSVLMVCTGNICRSPYAEHRLRAVLGAGSAVASAGTHGLRGWPADEGSEEVAQQRGFSCADHSARQVTAEMIAEAELVLGMGPDHRDFCAGLVPDAAGRIFTLHELAELLRSGAAGGASLGAVLASAHAARESLSRAARMRKVADPFGQLSSAFERMADDIEDQLEAILPVLR
jgi:protein-tyrosine phosphatase